MWTLYLPALIISFLPMYTILQKVVYITLSVLALQATLNSNFRNKLIVHRNDLTGKWWHRLKNILIYGTSIALIGYFCYDMYKSSWVEYDYPAYSFEPNYSSTKGKVINCSFMVKERNMDPVIDCGDYNHDFSFLEASLAGDDLRFLKRYFSAKISKKGSYQSYKLLQRFQTDKEILKVLINTGALDNIKAKETKTILYAAILNFIIESFLLVVVWFFFWEAVVYRAIIYIIYGKTKSVQ